MTTNTVRSLAACLFFFNIVAALTACSSEDDEYSLDYFYDKYTDKTTHEPVDSIVVSDTLSLAIDWNGTAANITGETDSVTVTQGKNANHIIINSSSSRYMLITLSGQTEDGSLLVYSIHPWEVVLNGVSIANNEGPAINNQCGKWLYVTLAEGTTNTLQDGAEYADAPKNSLNVSIDQKAAFFSEGQMLFKGNGVLNVNGNGKNGIASDDYIIMEEGNISVNVAATGNNGIKVNDGMQILGGVLGISVASQGGRGIKNDSYMTISGGETTIKTTGACKIETVDGVRDTTSAAGIKCDSIFTMTAGVLSINSSGDGGKGINCSDSILFSGGKLSVVTTGGKKQAKPKGVKSDKEVVVSGGTFESKVSKSKACDSGGSDTPTIIGTPVKKSLTDERYIYVEF